MIAQIKETMKRVAIFILGFQLIFFFYSYAQSGEFKELKSDHFIIKYVAQAQEYIYKIKDDAEYWYRAITQEFGLTQANLWAWENRVNIFVAGNHEDYLNRFNCPPWSSACVDYVRRIIYTYPSQTNFSTVFSHELTHIIFREYIGFSYLPLWIDEGMATYIEHRGSHQENLAVASIKQLIASNKYIPFSKLNNIYSLQADVDTAIFYNEAFSIIYFFMKRFGREDFKEFLGYLRGANSAQEAIRKSFGGIEDMNKLEDAWKTFYRL
jgi:hypothetical protein